MRDLFRKSVADVFGGESRIPASVRKAMLLSDYGKGKPLTARRILAVKTAIEAVKDTIDVAADNKKITDNIKTGRFRLLPPELNEGFQDAVDEIAARGGDGMPGNRAELVAFAGQLRIGNALAEHAKTLDRPLTREDVRDTILRLVRDEKMVEVAKLADFLKSGLVITHGETGSWWFATSLLKPTLTSRPP